jgi:hypothetical protein
MVALYNLFCWLPASIWAFVIAATTALTFLFSARPIWFGATVSVASLTVGVAVSSALPTGYLYYFAGFTVFLVTGPSILLATGLRQGWASHKTILLSMLPVGAVVASYLLNVADISDTWQRTMESMSKATVDWYGESMKVWASTFTAEEVGQVRETIEGFYRFMYRFFPGLVLIWAAAMNIASYFFAGRMLRKEGGFFRDVPSFGLWKAEFAVMAMLAAGLLLWISGLEVLRPLAENSLLVICVVYLVCGLSLAEFYLKRARLHPALRVAFYLMMLISGTVGGIALASMGLIDSHFDFRRVRAQQIG